MAFTKRVLPQRLKPGFVSALTAGLKPCSTLSRQRLWNWLSSRRAAVGVQFEASDNSRSLTPTRALLCPFTPNAGANGDPAKARARFTGFGMTISNDSNCTTTRTAFILTGVR